MNLTAKQSLAEAVASKKDRCDSLTCDREIRPGDAMWLDRLRMATYCEKCGIMMRYHRKKAEQRKEELPLTFTDVEERLNQ